MKKKIAILGHSMGGGGAERFITYLLESLTEDFEVHLLLFERRIEYKLPENIKIEYLENENLNERSNIINIFRLPIAVKKLKDYCKKNSVDIVISFLNRPNYVACLAKFFGLKAKVIINEQTNSILWYETGFLRRIFGNLSVKTLYSMADAIVPNAEGIRYLLEEKYKLTNKFYVTNNIIDLALINNLKKEAVEKIQFNNFTFIYASRLNPRKGHRLLLEAFAELKDQDCRLLLLGKGKLENELQEFAKELKISDRVVFLGFQINPFKYLSRADCFVMTSEFEGSPNVLVEAMACGIPVISTDCLTGPRELLSPNTHPLEQVQDGLEITDYGILVPVNNKKSLIAAMLKVINDPSLAQKFKECGIERTLSYDINVVIPKYKTFLESFIS